MALPNIGFQQRFASIGNAFQNAMTSLDSYIKEKGFEKTKQDYASEVQTRMGDNGYSPEQQKRVNSYINAIQDPQQFEAMAVAWEMQWQDFDANPKGRKPTFGIQYDTYQRARGEDRRVEKEALTQQQRGTIGRAAQQAFAGAPEQRETTSMRLGQEATSPQISLFGEQIAPQEKPAETREQFRQRLAQQLPPDTPQELVAESAAVQQLGSTLPSAQEPDTQKLRELRAETENLKQLNLKNYRENQAAQQRSRAISDRVSERIKQQKLNRDVLESYSDIIGDILALKEQARINAQYVAESTEDKAVKANLKAQAERAKIDYEDTAGVLDDIQKIIKEDVQKRKKQRKLSSITGAESSELRNAVKEFLVQQGFENPTEEMIQKQIDYYNQQKKQ